MKQSPPPTALLLAMVSATLFLSLISNASWNDNLTFGDTNSEYQLSSQVSSQCSRYELLSQVPVTRYELSSQVSVLRYELSLRVWISRYELSPRVSVS